MNVDQWFETTGTSHLRNKIHLHETVKSKMLKEDGTNKTGPLGHKVKFGSSKW